ncbi:MAG: thioredoxin family protein [Candidatus Rokubacteria bacterium]|nr:thioredoxin family protein [Candidatus Rokubacteria bacterium]
MVTKERFRQGMTFQQYLDQMGTNKEKFLQFLQEIKISSEDREAVKKLGGKKLNVVVITEDWCGDALYNFPVLARLVEGLRDVEMRVFLRDQNPDLMDQYLNRGLYRSIPVFAFFDENMNEIARFIERPPKVTEVIEQKMLEVRRALRAEHLEDWRQAVVDEVRGLMNV